MALTPKQKAAIGKYGRFGWHPFKKKGKTTPRRSEADVKEAQQFVAALKGTVPCASCKRVSTRRIGEAKQRRPLDWYPIDGRTRRITSMAARGASIEDIKEEMARCLALCAPCARRAVLK